MERRKNTRLDLRFPAEMRFPDGRVYKCHTRNISFGGALVEPEAPAPEVSVGDCLLLILLQETPEPIAIEIDCCVVHAGDSRVGMQFLAIPVDSYDHFKNVMILNSEDPTALAEELEHHPGILGGRRATSPTQS